MNQMLGDVEMEGKLVTSQYFYNFTANKSELVASTSVLGGGEQRHTQA